VRCLPRQHILVTIGALIKQVLFKATVFYVNIFENIIYSCDAKLSAAYVYSEASHKSLEESPIHAQETAFTTTKHIF